MVFGRNVDQVGEFLWCRSSFRGIESSVAILCINMAEFHPARVATLSQRARVRQKIS